MTTTLHSLDEDFFFFFPAVLKVEASIFLRSLLQNVGRLPGCDRPQTYSQ